ncbi:MAG TPA: hypothetical protein VN376_10040 [Longilinea sp.]|nr:hypothetical protein [Longilinea sp.]
MPSLDPTSWQADPQEKKRSAIWGIWVPLIGSIVVVFVAAIFSIVAAAQGSAGINRWSSISIIWLILPTGFLCLLGLLLIIAMIYGMYKLLPILPGWFKKVQSLLWRGSVYIQHYADKAAEPFLQGKQKTSAGVQLIHSIRRRLHGLWHTD